MGLHARELTREVFVVLNREDKPDLLVRRTDKVQWRRAMFQMRDGLCRVLLRALGSPTIQLARAVPSPATAGVRIARCQPAEMFLAPRRAGQPANGVPRAIEARQARNNLTAGQERPREDTEITFLDLPAAYCRHRGVIRRAGTHPVILRDHIAGVPDATARVGMAVLRDTTDLRMADAVTADLLTAAAVLPIVDGVIADLPTEADGVIAAPLMAAEADAPIAVVVDALLAEAVDIPQAAALVAAVVHMDQATVEDTASGR